MRGTRKSESHGGFGSESRVYLSQELLWGAPEKSNQDNNAHAATGSGNHCHAASMPTAGTAALTFGGRSTLFSLTIRGAMNHPRDQRSRRSDAAPYNSWSAQSDRD